MWCHVHSDGAARGIRPGCPSSGAPPENCPPAGRSLCGPSLSRVPTVQSRHSRLDAVETPLSQRLPRWGPWTCHNRRWRHICEIINLTCLQVWIQFPDHLQTQTGKRWDDPTLEVVQLQLITLTKLCFQIYKTLYKRRAQESSVLRPGYLPMPYGFEPPGFLYDIFVPPCPPLVPGIIGGEYDMRPILPSNMLPRPRYDPINPLSGHQHRPPRDDLLGRRSLRGRSADIRRGFIWGCKG